MAGQRPTSCDVAEKGADGFDLGVPIHDRSDTAAGLPFIGTHPGEPRTWWALGYGGNGITFSFLAVVIAFPSRQALIRSYMRPITCNIDSYPSARYYRRTEKVLTEQPIRRGQP